MRVRIVVTSTDEQVLSSEWRGRGKVRRGRLRLTGFEDEQEGAELAEWANQTGNRVQVRRTAMFDDEDVSSAPFLLVSFPSRQGCLGKGAVRDAERCATCDRFLHAPTVDNPQGVCEGASELDFFSDQLLAVAKMDLIRDVFLAEEIHQHPLHGSDFGILTAAKSLGFRVGLYDDECPTCGGPRRAAPFRGIVNHWSYRPPTKHAEVFSLGEMPSALAVTQGVAAQLSDRRGGEELVVQPLFLDTR